tara:strand:- start:85 stop:303 length:219 start_codon:yes stop_codon:yes gene_type:complete
LLAGGWFCYSAKDILKLREIKGLREKVNNPKFSRGYRILDFAMGGDDNGRRSLRRGEGLEKFQAILIGQSDV